MRPVAKRFPFDRLRAVLGDNLQADIPLARFTAARIGGPADALLVVESLDELRKAVLALWELKAPFVILGGGSNVLVSDDGYRGVVWLNRARTIRFTEQHDSPTVWAASGANFGNVARRAVTRGYGGLEWAAGIPGSVGGAVVGNAGAHGGDVAGSLVMAEILHQDGSQRKYAAAEMGFAYRSSGLKRGELTGVVLAACFALQPGEPEVLQRKLDELVTYRRRTQPPGASMGSMFKNPPGDFAGRLIEAAGLKGLRIGGAEISPVHANFFVNRGEACAQDVYELICRARQAVAKQFGVELELEIELLGKFES